MSSYKTKNNWFFKNQYFLKQWSSYCMYLLKISIVAVVYFSCLEWNIEFPLSIQSLKITFTLVKISGTDQTHYNQQK